MPVPRRWLLLTLFTLAACSRQTEAPAGSAAYVPVAEVERAFGPMLTAGNIHTPDQHGTGDRVGLFRAADGTIWGLPLTVKEGGQVLGCIPSAVRDAPATDTLPAGSTILGTSNEPTGWRGGTGNLELLLRDSNGQVQWKAVRSGQLTSGTVCRAQSPPDPREPLPYYRLR